MKIKHEEIKILILGDIYSFYIRRIKKHWWSPWIIVMDGQVPARYQLINGEFIMSI